MLMDGGQKNALESADSHCEAELTMAQSYVHLEYSMLGAKKKVLHSFNYCKIFGPLSFEFSSLSW